MQPEGTTIQWLIKWSGLVQVINQGSQKKTLHRSRRYPIDRGSWEPENSMVEPSVLIEGFNAAAINDGNELDCGAQVILLKEAIDAGWRGLEEHELTL